MRLGLNAALVDDDVHGRLVAAALLLVSSALTGCHDVGRLLGERKLKHTKKKTIVIQIKL